MCANSCHCIVHSGSTRLCTKGIKRLAVILWRIIETTNSTFQVGISHCVQGLAYKYLYIPWTIHLNSLVWSRMHGWLCFLCALVCILVVTFPWKLHIASEHISQRKMFHEFHGLVFIIISYIFIQLSRLTTKILINQFEHKIQQVRPKHATNMIVYTFLCVA